MCHRLSGKIFLGASNTSKIFLHLTGGQSTFKCNFRNVSWVTNLLKVWSLWGTNPLRVRSYESFKTALDCKHFLKTVYHSLWINTCLLRYETKQHLKLTHPSTNNCAFKTYESSLGLKFIVKNLSTQKVSHKSTNRISHLFIKHVATYVI